MVTVPGFVQTCMRNPNFILRQFLIKRLSRAVLYTLTNSNGILYSDANTSTPFGTMLFQIKGWPKNEAQFIFKNVVSLKFFIDVSTFNDEKT